MSDIVERLRNLARNYADGVAGMSPQNHFAWDAADEIERLQEIFRRDGEQHAAHIRALEEQHQARLTAYAAEIERLTALLEKIEHHPHATGEIRMYAKRRAPEGK